MKKARIILSAMVVFAIVGGALAFKPSKFTDSNLYCPVSTTSPALNRCPLAPYSSIDQGIGTTTLGCISPTNPNVTYSFAFTTYYTTTTAVGGPTLTYCVPAATTSVLYKTIVE